MILFDVASSALMSIVEDHLVEQADNKAGAALDRKKLEKQVRDLVERYREHFETLSLTEEFDFDRLNDFLREHLWQEVAACFNAPGREQQEAARRLLFDSAYIHAGADTQAKKDTTREYLRLFLEVVEQHFLAQVEGKEWFLCGRTVDEITQAVDLYLQQHTVQIKEAIRYHGSFAEYIDNLRPTGSNRNEFHYRNTSLGFYGREQEMEALDAFLNQEEQILWMAVVGDGGVGKSTLLYHYCKQISNRPGWRTVWLSKDGCQRINQFPNWYYPDRLLVVADYAGEMTEQLGDWLSRLAEIASRCRPKQLRLILLERENLGDVMPFWYQTFTGSRERRRAVEQFCSNQNRPCLKLSGPGDEALENLVKDYARSKGKQDKLTETKLVFVLEKAHEIDQDDSAPRPLITLFIADAVLDGNEYTHWSVPALLENIIDRYRDHWKYSVCKGDEKLFDALQQVLVYATAVDGWDLTELPAPLETASRTLLASGRVLEPLVCAVNEEDTFRGRLSPLEPDLVGEFYVLDYLKDRFYNKTTLIALVQLFWEQDNNFFNFLNRCIQNYCNEQRFQKLFQNSLAVFQPNTEELSVMLLFAMLLVNLTAKQSSKEAAQTVGRLEVLVEKYSNSEEIALTYASGLFNLSNKQSLKEAVQIVGRLESLTRKYPDSEVITLSYAKGLVNLACDQSLEKAVQTVGRLETLAGKYPDSEEITLTYADGLLNLSNKQSLEEAAQTVGRLESLTGKYPDSEEITLTYANSLFNLACDQSLEEAVQTVGRLETLAGKYSDSEKITLTYARGLANLVFGQSLKKAVQTVNRLEALAGKYSDSEEITLTYARGLADLAFGQSLKEAVQTVSRLESLVEKYPDSKKITFEYANGLVGLAFHQSLEEAVQTVSRLEALAGKYPDSEEITYLYTELRDILIGG